MILFVVNMNSGNGRGAKVWRQVEQRLQARGTTYRAVLSSNGQDAYERTAAQLSDTEWKAIAVVGGDGTLHGLLPLLVGTGIPVGIIPAGSGNDTSRAFRIPRDPIQALDIIVSGRTRLTDAIASTSGLETQVTITAIAVGMDGAVAADVNGSRYKRWCNRLGIGSLAYLIGFVRGLAKFSPSDMTITVDGTVHRFRRGWLSAVANIASYGGGLRICPDARFDDGQLHVCVVHGCSLWRILFVFPTILKGAHVKLRNVTLLKGRQVTIEPSGRFLAYGDGEPSGATPLQAELLPGQLVFLTTFSG
ncbi:diacylglycerol/lipid kinase family protein [Cohnella panacarvi]|uniref:diacylglycerol/lipid kinase family protein n=1 Tax=Cohnella panacarvi TaxID=400776 RepID=UPI00047A6350|nr:diacylglycerol kinase family protein [Cohnella panacarvi]